MTGVGACTPLGADLDTTWARLLAGDCAAQRHDDLAELALSTDVACRVPGMSSVEATHRGRRLARGAVAAAVADADVSIPPGVGVFVGTTMGESGAFEAHRGGGVPTDATADVFARALADELGATGPTRTFGAACAAGNYAIGSAAAAIRRGRADVVIAGGVEPFSLIAMVGFARMRAMTHDRCRPFAADRRGMQLGEGAAFLVLESADHARRRGAKALARVGRLGLSCDAHHPTRPLAGGEGMAVAMTASIERSGLDPSDIGWVNTHGTGTPASDAAESAALKIAFGPQPPPITACKGALGHSLGAATAIEAAITIRALEAAAIPPTANVEASDPALGVDLVTRPRSAPTQTWVLNCGYAFGGLNSALTLGTP
ncbi:MAG: beta-ketoacyl synthase N-terminal-like domain-containing protein [Ilumatobacter sp.]